MTNEPSRRARAILADAIAARGPAWKPAADSVRAGTYANAWIEAAIVAVDMALDAEPDDD